MRLIRTTALAAALAFGFAAPAAAETSELSSGSVALLAASQICPAVVLSDERVGLLGMIFAAEEGLPYNSDTARIFGARAALLASEFKRSGMVDVLCASAENAMRNNGL